MFKSIKIGRLAGFDIQVNTSFLILLGLVALLQGFWAGLTLAVVVFGSVLLHELGHAIVARRLQVPIAGIELHFFGGVAKMAGSPRSPRDEILIAVAGPAVSFALAGIGIVISWLTPLPGASLFAGVNLVLGVFNLIPALPMDGGRVFRAALSKKLGRLKATELAVRITHGLAILLGVAAAWSGNWHLVAVAVVIWLMGSQERRVARYWHYEGEKPEVEVLGRDGHSRGWFTRDGEHAEGPPPGGSSEETVSGRTGETNADAPKASRRVYKSGDGGWVVVERVRW